MKKLALMVALLPLTGPLLYVQPAGAQIYQPDVPRILLHVMAPTAKNACTTYPLSSLGGSCLNAVTSARSNSDGTASYFVYIVVVKGDSVDGISGVQLGIDYDAEYIHDETSISDGLGIDMLGWFLCATLEFPGFGWTSAGALPVSGNLITWNSTTDCQTGPVAIAGYFYVAAYTHTTMWVMPRPADNLAQVTDCVGGETPVWSSMLGYATFSVSGNVEGCNPCDFSCIIDPVQPTTWSRVKTMAH
jgi:hypothetical protein